MVDAPQTLSKSAFAARRGVAVSAVSKWIARGRVSGAALTPDGRIVVAEAERQLGATLDLSRSLGKVKGGGDLDEMAAIKMERARRDLQRDREGDELRRGRYTLTEQSERAAKRGMSQYLLTVEQRAPELMELLGVDKRVGITVFRRWWRSLRQEEATAIRERAESLPEFVVDAPELEALHAA
jgi:hypothetical protein